MPRKSGSLASLAIVAALGLTGCAAAATGGSEAPAERVEFTCALNGEMREVHLGETFTVFRGPDGKCQGLEPGSTQTFEFHSHRVDAEVKRTAEVAVAADGSFTFELAVPADMRIGYAALQPVPTKEGCEEAGVLDCPPASARFRVSHPPSALRDVTVLSTGIDAPALPHPEWSKAYAYHGPQSDQLTVVIISSSCLTLPGSFVTTAPAGSLELVSESPDGDKGCNDVATPWTSVIEIPTAFTDFTSVKVDNVPAEILPARPAG